MLKSVENAVAESTVVDTVIDTVVDTVESHAAENGIVIDMHMPYFKNEQPLCITIVAKTKDLDQIVGAAECSHTGDRSYYFNRLFIQPAFRGYGYATQILTKLLELFKERDFELRLDVNAYGDLDNQQLEEFYMRHGFKRYLLNDPDFPEACVFYYNKLATTVIE